MTPRGPTETMIGRRTGRRYGPRLRAIKAPASLLPASASIVLILVYMLYWKMQYGGGIIEIDSLFGVVESKNWDALTELAVRERLT